MTGKIDMHDIAHLRALLAKATPGPWEWWTSNYWTRLSANREGDVLLPTVCRDGHPDLIISDANAALISAARNALPMLLDAYEAQAAEIERLRHVVNAADKGSPIYKAIERALDEHSAWIARPNADVTRAIALAAGVAWMAAEPIDQNLEEIDAALAEERARCAEQEAEIERLRSALDAVVCRVRDERLRADKQADAIPHP